jgi:hypothetical protein
MGDTEAENNKKEPNNTSIKPSWIKSKSCTSAKTDLPTFHRLQREPDILMFGKKTTFLNPSYHQSMGCRVESKLHADTTQALYLCIDRCRPKLSDAYWSSYKNADDFPHTKRRLSAHTNLSTFWSPFT